MFDLQADNKLGCLNQQAYQNYAKRRVGKMFSLVTLSQLRGGHMPFRLSFPLLVLKLNLMVVEPQMHMLRGHSCSTRKAHEAACVGEMLHDPRRRTFLGNKALFVAFWFWKFHFHCGNLCVVHLVGHLAIVKWLCKVSWCCPLWCCLLTYIHLLSMRPFLYTSQTVNYLVNELTETYTKPDDVWEFVKQGLGKRTRRGSGLFL